MAKKAKKSKATAQDAGLILKLYDLRREPVIRKARDFMTSQFWPQNYGEFKAVVVAFGTEQNAWFRQVWTYWDMACAMVLNGAINEDLFFQTNGEPFFLYAKFKPFFEQIRKDLNSPELMAHVEELANKTAEAKERVKRLEARIAARAAQMAAAKAAAK
ncbi:MAG TPA: hypothetical protein VI636_24420 [Candidatus Angelobacter sp.]